MEQRNALSKAILAMLCVVAAGLIACFVTLLYSINAQPGNKPNYEIKYDFDDDHLVGLCEMLAPNVVELKYGESAATGFIYTFDDGKPIVLTNRHLADGTDDGFSVERVSVRFVGESSFRDDYFTALGYDVLDDVVVLKGKSAVPVHAIDLVAEGKTSDTVKMGQRVLGLGNAMGKGISAFEGIVGNVSRVISVNGRTVAVFQITAPVNAGCSGGPLFDMAGRLVGINTYQTNSFGTNNRPIDGVSYSVPHKIIKTVVELSKSTGGGQITKGEALLDIDANGDVTVRHDGLGVYMRVIDGKLTVTFKTALSDSSLREGDVIVKIGDETDCTDYAAVVSAFYPYVRMEGGLPLSYTVVRGGATVEVFDRTYGRAV